jgi:hypothetical protein
MSQNSKTLKKVPLLGLISLAVSLDLLPKPNSGRLSENRVRP